jgi:hypothetical protein
LKLADLKIGDLKIALLTIIISKRSRFLTSAICIKYYILGNVLHSFILKLLYRNPELYFPNEYNENGEILPKPTRPNFLKLLNIISWCRYADDVCCIIKKDSIDKNFQKINSWDAKVKFKYERMTNNTLIFLDFELIPTQ